MFYPFLLYSPEVDHRPLLPGLAGAPFIADLSTGSPLLRGRDPRDQKGLQAALEAAMGSTYSWGLSPYLERRDTLLSDCPQMVADRRFVHLGLDIIAPLGTALHAPLDAVVDRSGYESGEGNYGGWVLLRHESPRFEAFYSLCGHLCTGRLPEAGRRLAAGEAFARIGDFHENGNWFHHTHLQVITRKGMDRGWLSKGYGTESDLAEMNDLCPSPVPLFTPGNRGAAAGR